MRNRHGSTVLARVLALVAALALALGAQACGGLDDEDGANGGGAATAAEDGRSTADIGGPEGEIHAAYEKFSTAMSEHDAKAACAMLTPQQARKTGSGISCERRLGGLLEGSEPGKPAFITKLDVNGNSAVAKVKTKTSDVYTVRFAKRNGEWKIDGDEE